MQKSCSIKWVKLLLHFCIKCGKICRAKFKVWPLIKISLYTATLLQDLFQNFGSIKFNLAKVLQYKVTLNKNASLLSWNFIIKRLQHRCFLMNIVQYLRTPVLKNICEQLFERFPIWANNITSNIESEEQIFSKAKEKKNILKLS